MYTQINGKPLKEMDFEELKRYFSVSILQAFVEEGGKGLSAELNRIMSTTIDWYEKTIE